ncbi:hypothetical protein BDD14_4833 [Edaphobacter modestus]|uniref:Uncharacterized protein n=1 Tax=Edaphobacter modestus TaxID=388466 RepID=A0A4Q7YZC8_9BACT|nr:hypothetical protein BDD14_4833 [Edaphobacter modestus]
MMIARLTRILVLIAPWLRQRMGERDALCEETRPEKALPDSVVALSSAKNSLKHAPLLRIPDRNAFVSSWKA